MCSYSEFVEAYNNPHITGHDVRRIKGLNGNQYSKLRAKALRLGDIPAHRYMINPNAKYYTKTPTGDFQVQKTINGRKIIVGRFADEETAKEIVDACIKVDWDIKQIDYLIKWKGVKPKNYTVNNGRWIIQKSINGRNVAFNTFLQSKVDEDTIIDIVDFYRENDWDLTLKDKIKDLFNIN